MCYLYNHYFKTFPLIAHNPLIDIACPIWHGLEHDICPLNRCFVPDELTIVTWNNFSYDSPLELQLKKMNIDYVCLGKGLEWFTNRNKPLTLMQARHLIKTKYVLGLDSFDVIIVQNLEHIITRFKSLNAKLVYNATATVYPDVLSDKELEKTLAPAPYHFFNSGMFLGEIDYLTEVLEEVDFNDKDYPTSDQYLLRKLYHKYYPTIQIDWGCRIFQVVKDSKLEDFVTLKSRYRLL